MRNPIEDEDALQKREYAIDASRCPTCGQPDNNGLECPPCWRERAQGEAESRAEDDAQDRRAFLGDYRND